ncbi:MAG: SagB/ThcOx family dehydrogenase [Promethearchaeota archaeon]|nr:MAG: SagB/ThcOx family dehydrogenase [Candidatus Lokiarchaeota archaeon]
MNVVIHLPEVKVDEGKSLEQCIYERKSMRKFWDKEISLEHLSKIFWAVQGAKEYNRTVPSAGATYPLEIYAILKEKGLYHYKIKEHKLVTQIEKFNCRELVRAAWNQTFICEPYLTLIICGDIKRTRNRYGERAERYVYMEAGHAAQNVHLEAVSLDLASVPIGAFKEESVKALLELPKEIDPLYIIPVGYPK